MLNDNACYAAILARDPRYNGVFFVGVQSTGVYCRSICPARTPGRARCSFYDSPARAEAAGFRACFRCRPELAPGAVTARGAATHSPARANPPRAPERASVDAIATLVAAAARRINEGALNDGSIDDLATELGVSARHLRRATEARLGVSPVALAQTRRMALAKQLLQDTALPVSAIAFAAGFGSVRRFNAMFAARMGTAPSEIRRKHATPTGDAITLRLDYRPPYDWRHLFAFLRARAIPGVERVEADAYHRVVHAGEHVGRVAVRPWPGRNALALELAPSLLPVLLPLTTRVRRMFDLDARPDLIDRALARDPLLAASIAARPGLRVPGAIDAFEAAIRALLGQQVSVAGATTLAGRFAAQLGARVGDGELAYRFPTAAEVCSDGVDRIARIGLPRKRAEAIYHLARAVAAGALSLERVADLDAIVEQLTALPGIGPWTAHYLAMRALHLPDAFPASDLGIQKALGRAGAVEAEARAEAWRPYRSYAVMHLWTSLAKGDLQ